MNLEKQWSPYKLCCPPVVQLHLLTQKPNKFAVEPLDAERGGASLHETHAPQWRIIDRRQADVVIKVGISCSFEISERERRWHVRFYLLIQHQQTTENIKTKTLINSKHCNHLSPTIRAKRHSTYWAAQITNMKEKHLWSQCTPRLT